MNKPYITIYLVLSTQFCGKRLTQNIFCDIIDV